jgi:hypothetical protein
VSAAFKVEGFVYSNLTSLDAPIKAFRGREQIANSLGEVVGYHVFHGIYFEP